MGIQQDPLVLTKESHAVISAQICLLSVVTIFSMTQSRVDESDAVEEARALVQISQHREDIVLKGVEWHWKVERGRSRSAEDAVKGIFDRSLPVDSYECRWLTNAGAFLYESLAQQPRRITERVPGQQIVLTTDGSDQFLATEHSHLHFDPKPFVSWSGEVENDTNGLTPHPLSRRLIQQTTSRITHAAIIAQPTAMMAISHGPSRKSR